MHPSVGGLLDGGQCARILVAHLGQRFHGFANQIAVFEHIQARHPHSVAVQFLVAAQHHLVGFGPDGGHESRIAQCNAQALALPDGIKRVALVVAHHGSVLHHKLTARHFFGQAVHAAFQETPVVIVGHKADFVRFGFVDQTEKAPLGSHPPDFWLVQVSERENGAAQALLRHAPQRVRLVFVFVQALGNHVTAIFMAQIGVVARGDELAIQFVGPAQQRVPFDVRVAEHARVGRAAGQVFAGEIINHEVAELIADVKDVVRETELHGHLAGIVDGVQAAAAGFLFGTAHRRIIPGFHGHADHLVALLVQQHGRQRTVNAAAHGHQNAPFLAHGWVS